jgi:dipeptidyl aminopeptidase/acylaminoacyl peptidase
MPPLFAHINLWGTPFNLPKSPTKRFPSTLMVHGTDDDQVPYHNSVAIARTLERLGVYNELMTIEGVGHTPVSHFDDIVLRIERFLQKRTI